MPPPPVTPSPHRFVIKKAAPVRRTPLVQEHKPPPPSNTQPQFKSTPRFHISSTPRPTPTQNYASATPYASRYLTPARKAPGEQDVDILSSDSTNHDVHDSIEVDEQDEEDEELGYGYEEEDEYLLDEPTLKRRRLSSTAVEPPPNHHYPPQNEPHSSSSPLPILSSPPAQPFRRTTVASRFKTPFPLPPSTPAAANPTTQTPFRKPPPFRPPDPTETAQSPGDPLPEQFSPHGKGRKYVPGGLAAELQGWLFNVESVIPTHRNRNAEDAWLVRILVDEVGGGLRSGMTLVRGRQVHNMDGGGGDGGEGRMDDILGEVRVILAGEAAMTGLQRGKGVEVGVAVGIKGPVWEVVVEGERWGVGVEWKVLS